MANKVYGFTYKQDTEDKILTLKKFEMSYDDACKEVQMKAMGEDLGLTKLNNFMNPMSIVSEAKSFIATNTIDMSWCSPTQGGMTFDFYRPKLQRLFPENSAEIEQILTMLIA